MQKGQGALEYLLLIGGAVLIAVVVITLLLGIGQTGGDQTSLTAATAMCKQKAALPGAVCEGTVVSISGKDFPCSGTKENCVAGSSVVTLSCTVPADCTSPPNNDGCYYPQGSCSAGVCSYTKYADGDACATGLGTCLNGECITSTPLSFVSISPASGSTIIYGELPKTFQVVYSGAEGQNVSLYICTDDTCAGSICSGSSFSSPVSCTADTLPVGENNYFIWLQTDSERVTENYTVTFYPGGPTP